MKQLTLVLLALVPALANATLSTTGWTPIFKGIEHAIGTNVPDVSFPRRQSVNCLRIDLTDPDVRLFTSSRHSNYVQNGSIESYAMSITNFMRRSGVAVATAANFYNTPQGSSPTTENISSQIFGLLINTGQVVSVSDYGPDANNRWASLLFTTNKEPFMVWPNSPPGTNTDGIFTAVSGYYPVITNGVVPPATWFTSTFPDQTVHNSQPRTAFGISEDKRYLFLMIIDGRQNNYSDGATSVETGLWLQQFGAWNGINMDGGGSAAMYRQDCSGQPQALGRSSYLVSYGRERILGAQFGVYAKPLDTFVSNVATEPGSTTALVTWLTPTNSTSRVEYGLTTALGLFSPLDSNLVTNHAVTLTSLTPGRRYYYRVISSAGGTDYSSTCGQLSFTTTNFGGGLLFGISNSWKYSVANLDGINWAARTYDDSTWTVGNGTLWAYRTDQAVPSYYASTVPGWSSGTRMPVTTGSPPFPFSTYYFRTAFTWSNDVAGATLTFSNFLDDGAIFYLNGVEVYRTNMAPGQALNGTYTPAGCPCPALGPSPAGNATCPMVFELIGAALESTLQVGTNVIAVEVHNFRSLSTLSPSPDITFTEALFYSLPPPVELPPFFSNVVVLPGETNAVITWTTLSNATSRIEYGTTPALGSSTPLDANSTMNHAMVVQGLQPVTQYYFRIIAVSGTRTNTHDGTFTTIPFLQPVLTSASTWRFTTNNLEGTSWMAADYNDSGWLGQGTGLFYIENNTDVTPRTTPLPPAAGGLPFPAYYFRTTFTVSNALDGFALVFSNYVDDGAIFYLNGVEIQRIRMSAPQPVGYSSLASGCPADACEASRDVPDVFRISGDVLTNLVAGQNVLAVEVHQQDASSDDVVFGSEVSIVRALASETEISISRTNEAICVKWNGNFKLQRALTVGAGAVWTDVAGAVSPYCATNASGAAYFRLKE